MVDGHDRKHNTGHALFFWKGPHQHGVKLITKIWSVARDPPKGFYRHTEGYL